MAMGAACGGWGERHGVRSGETAAACPALAPPAPPSPAPLFCRKC